MPSATAMIPSINTIVQWAPLRQGTLCAARFLTLFDMPSPLLNGSEPMWLAHSGGTSEDAPEQSSSSTVSIFLPVIERGPCAPSARNGRSERQHVTSFFDEVAERLTDVDGLHAHVHELIVNAEVLCALPAGPST